MGILNKRKRAVEESADRVLDVTASMQGSLTFQEPVSLRISGRFEGTLETKGDLTIGERAVVQADVTGEVVTLAGQVTGKLVAKRSLRIIPPAVLNGEIWTPVLEVESGARIEGTIHMTEEGGWMSLEEVAEYLEVDVRLIEQWAREGKISGVKGGSQWRFQKAKIDQWVSTQKSS
jgi:excisionase family DNA binding protein